MGSDYAERHELGEIESSLGDEIQEYGRRISRYGDPNTIRVLRAIANDAPDDIVDAEDHYVAVLRRVRRLKTICDLLERMAKEMQMELF